MSTANNFYNILDIPTNASKLDIKRAYHKLALMYHPDKNKTNNSDKFQQINIAYNILYDDNKREQYDKLTIKQRMNINIIFKELLEKLINRQNNYQADEFEKIKLLIFDKIFNEIIRYFIPNNQVNDLTSIFISNEKYVDINKDYSNYETSLSNTHTSEINMQLTIFTTLEEIYNNKIKELTIMRHKINNEIEEKKLYIPLYSDKYIIRNQGDEYINNENIVKGDIMIKIKCKKHKYITRINDYDILLKLPITINELIYGIKKKIRYLDKEIITIEIAHPYSKYKNNCIEIVFENYGLPYDNENRGNLIIEFNL